MSEMEKLEILRSGGDPMNLRFGSGGEGQVYGIGDVEGVIQRFHSGEGGVELLASVGVVGHLRRAIRHAGRHRHLRQVKNFALSYSPHHQSLAMVPPLPSLPS